MKHFIAASLFSLLGVLVYPLLGAMQWEEEFGLPRLFEWRGSRPVPEQLMLVTIGAETGPALGLPDRMTDWPRSVYAEAVTRLAAKGVRVIAFDVFFREARDSEPDRRFAEAIRDCKCVILFAHSRRQALELQPGQHGYVDHIEEPLPLFARHAVTTAPFMLPKWPARVSRFWTHHEGAGHRPTLPLAALMAWQRDSGARIDLDDGPTERLFNFYGPPRTVPMLELERLLSDQPLPFDLEGRVTFLGFVARYQPDQRDGFYTLYSRADGVDLTGVELAATAFGNLLEGSDVRPLVEPLWLALVFAFGLLVHAVSNAFKPLTALPVSVGLASAYVGLAYFLFVRFYLWLPLVVPLLIQLPLALLWSAMLRARDLRQQRDRIRAAFGLYLPDAEVKRLAREPQAPAQRARLSGVCLATDAENYTTLAERLPPDELAQVMADYYEAVFRPVRACDGLISDVAGDGIIALWPKLELNDELFECVCEAAQNIQQAVEDFNRSHPETPLPTRIGIHAGDVVLGHLGALDHFEYRAVGDIVNTACRIQSLNKQLGTAVLLSMNCRPTNSDCPMRDLGSFLLSGKRNPVRLYELLGQVDRPNALLYGFAEALRALREGQVNEALSLFDQLVLSHPTDGPSAFYRRQCQASLAGDDNLAVDGSVRLTSK